VAPKPFLNVRSQVSGFRIKGKAFPFRLPDGELFFEGQGGIIKPGRDQLPGTSSDWNVIKTLPV